MNTGRQMAIYAHYIEKAREQDPGGCVCGFCGKENDAADDCGWWYLWPDKDNDADRPACLDCLRGEPGERHRERYGVGDR